MTMEQVFSWIDMKLVVLDTALSCIAIYIRYGKDLIEKVSIQIQHHSTISLKSPLGCNTSMSLCFIRRFKQTTWKF